MSMRFRSCGIAISLLVWVALLGAQPVLAADGSSNPSAKELWNTYPLYPTASPEQQRAAGPTSTAAGQDRRGATRVPAARAASGGGRAVLLVLLVILGAAVGLGSHRLRSRGTAYEAAPSITEAGGERRPPVLPPTEAVAAPVASFGRVAPQPPWPEDTEDLWRCEIRLNGDSLSSRLHAVVFPPDGGEGSAIGTSMASTPASDGETDWQSPQRFQQAVRTLATALESSGWEPVGQGAGWYARRFCWRRDEPPPQRVEPVPAELGGAAE